MLVRADKTTQLTKTAAAALTTAVVDPDPLLTVSEHVYRVSRYDGTDNPPGRRELLWRAGQQIRTSELNAQFPAGVVSAVMPATGPVAGGTPVTITGENFTPGSTVTFGGTAAAGVVVVNERKIRCVAPARAAGAVAVAVTTDAGAASKASAYTYA